MKNRFNSRVSLAAMSGGRLVPTRVARARLVDPNPSHDTLEASGYTPTGLKLANNVQSQRRPFSARENRPKPHELAPKRPQTPRAQEAMAKHCARLSIARSGTENSVVVTSAGLTSPHSDAGFVTSTGPYRSRLEQAASEERAAKAASIHPQTWRPGGFWKSQDKPQKPITGTGPYEGPWERAAREERERRLTSIHPQTWRPGGFWKTQDKPPRPITRTGKYESDWERHMREEKESKLSSIHPQPWKPGRWAVAAGTHPLSNNIGPSPPGGF